MNQMVLALYKGSRNQGNENEVTASSQSHDRPHTERLNDGEEILASEVYRKIQHGADIPLLGLQKPAPEKPTNFRYQTSDVIRKSLPVSETDTRRKEEKIADRKKRLEKLNEELRRTRLKQETEKNAARRHHDFFTSAQKSPISPDRFEDALAYSWEQLSPEPHHSLSEKYKLTTSSVLPQKCQEYQIQGRAKALYSFTAQNRRELTLKKGDVIYLLRRVDRNWFEGEHYGQVGIVPANYLQILTPREEADGPVEREGQARAKFDFVAQTSKELSLRKGEFVTLLRRIDENWVEGRTSGGRGIFPVAYIDIIKEPSSLPVTPLSSVITSPLTGTHEMMSPVSSDAQTTPHPSPSTAAQCCLGNSTSGSVQSNKFSHEPWSLEENRIPEFNIYEQNNSPCPIAENGLTVEWPDLSEMAATVTVPNLEMYGNQASLGNDSIKRPCPSVSLQELIIPRYRVIHAYSPRAKDELELLEDDEVYVTEKCDDGWFVGTSARTFQFGTFPGSHVQLL